MAGETTEPGAYARAGVNIAAGQHAVAQMAAAVRATHGAEVVASIGAFGGLYDAVGLHAMRAPVLVASTDGVGTKTMVAARMTGWETIGHDLVNHCVNDILVQGARPLFFLDYIASSVLDPVQIATIVGGMAAACQDVGCALLGGETAEMPGVYAPGQIDLVGTIVGIVERDHIIDGSEIVAGDMLVGLPSSGLHTNGYSLARATLDSLDWHVEHPMLGCPIGESLLAVHCCYAADIERIQSAGLAIHGLAHITGGGFFDNIPRILPPHLGVRIERGAWPIPPIFTLIQQQGNIPDDEMYHVFNMGIGMVVVMSAAQGEQACTILPGARIIGEVRDGGRAVVIG